MKKYLIKGAWALLAGMLAVSCAEKESEYVPLAQQKVKAFEDVFKEVYGEIDPYQDWGFSSGKIDIDLNDSSMVMEVIDVTEGEDNSDVLTRQALARRLLRAGTRGINVNGNEWKETPLCTEAEAKMVFDYVNMTLQKMDEKDHKYYLDFPYNLTDYYVTQVWTGSDTYSNADNSKTNIKGSSHMDHLHIAMTSSAEYENGRLIGGEGAWKHINNFNAASNMNWGGNTLVENGGTYDFAYLCSEDSRYHHKWIAIDGADVDASLAGKFYICFDFLADDPTSYTNFQDENGQNYEVAGIWTSVAEAVAAGAKARIYKEWDSVNNVAIYEEGPAVASNWTKGNVVGGNKNIPANNVYTDWIIRIVGATAQQPVDVYHETYENLWNPVEAGRVFCEDLGKASREDLDYNDLVFDARIWSYKRKTIKWKWHYNDVDDAEPASKTEDGMTESDPIYYADIKLLAAGGTIPISIADRQVHDLFSASVETMINTRDNNSTAYGSYDTRGAVVVGDATKGDEYRKFKTTSGSEFELWLIPGYSSISSIPIVSAFDWATVQELGANRGEAPHKIMVKYGTTKWTSERKNISLAYPRFNEYVTGHINESGWVDAPVSQYLYSGAVNGESSSSPKAIKSTTERIGDAVVVLWTGSVALGSSWGYASLSSPYSMGDGFYPNDRIRFQGTVTAEGDNAPVITVSFADDSQPYLIENTQFAEKLENGSYPSEAYVEVTLNQDLCNRMNNSKENGQITLHVQGRGFTLTQIGFIPYKSAQ